MVFTLIALFVVLVAVLVVVGMRRMRGEDTYGRRK